MRIAMVFDKMLWGGIERVGISYINMLLEDNNLVDVYILDSNTENIVDELDGRCNVSIIDYKNGRCPENTWGFAICHNYGGLEMLYFSVKYTALKLVQKLTKAKYQVKGKEYDIVIAFSGHIKDLTFVTGDYIKAKHKIAWLHGAQYQYNLISPGFFRLYKEIKNLVCLSELCDAECTDFNKRNGIFKTKIYNPCVINMSGVDQDKVNDLQQKYGDFCLMVGRLARDKDQKTVILAMKYLRDCFGIFKKLVLVGGGEKREELKQLVEEQGLQDMVFFEGIHSDVQNYYSAACIYVHSAPLEGFPTVFMEAMSFGLPIVTTDAIPGAREMLGNDEFGLISPVGNYQLLAENIKKVYENEALRESLIKKGKLRVRDFSSETIRSQITELFENIMRN